jgi:hypothetical protein
VDIPSEKVKFFHPEQGTIGVYTTLSHCWGGKRSSTSSQSAKRSAQSVVVSPRKEILPISLANATFDAPPSGMPTPLTSKPEKLDTPFDGIKSLEAFTVERLNEIIAKKAILITLSFTVSFKDIERWATNKEDIGGFEYDSSTKRLIITADGGPIHESQVQLSSSGLWPGRLENRDERAEAGLAPHKFIRNFPRMIADPIYYSLQTPRS